MFRKETLAQIKQLHKELAQQLREAKVLIHQPHTYKEMWAVRDLKHTYRHRHIAYCLLRGRTMEQIEKPRENNQPNARDIEMFKTCYEEAFELETHEARRKHLGE